MKNIVEELSDWWSPDLVLLNGKIITVDPEDNIAEAVAVKDGKIVNIGTTNDIKRLVVDRTRVIDLKEKTVTPGLIDNHIHVIGLGTKRLGWTIELRYPYVKSISELVKLVEEKVKQTPKGEWIRGAGWDEKLYEEQRMPNKWDIDPVSPDNPVWLSSASAFGMCNSYALKLAGLTKDSPEISEVWGEKDPKTLEPTGIIKLKPGRHDLIPGRSQELSIKQYEEAIKEAERGYIMEGITTVKNPGIYDDYILAYRNLHRRNELIMRTNMLYRVLDTLSDAEKSVKYANVYGDDILKLGGFKIWLDGSGGARSAWVHEDWNINYTETEVGNRGRHIPEDEFKKMFTLLHKTGRQVCVHCIGDAAIDLYLDVLEETLEECPRENCRHTIIHANIPTKKANDRMQKLGSNIALEPQGCFIYWLGDLYAGNFGPERCKRFLPFKTWLEKGIITSSGSDYQSADYPPRYGLYSMCTRKTLAGRYGWQPFGTEECITIQEALRVYTINSAKCLFWEDQIGSIEPGKYADMVVWNKDMYTIPIEDLINLKVEMTIIGGKIVYQSLTHIITRACL